MDEHVALIHAYLLDGKGGGKEVAWADIDGWAPEHGVLWIHLDSMHPDTADWLTARSGLTPLSRDSLLERESRPRNILTSEGLLLILRGVNCNPGADPEDMVAIRMLLSEHRIITMRYRRVMAIADIREALDAGRGPCGTGDFLSMAAERIADRMGDVVAQLDDQADELEDSVLTAEGRELRGQLANLRRGAISLRRYIAPQRDVLARLLHDRISWIASRDLALLREVAERTARFVEDVDSARERAAVTQEELNSQLSEQMNKAMYTLSIVAAIFLPLGLLTGLLGINVGGIPGTENNWAFTIVTVSLVAVAAGLIILFRKIKWL